MDFESFRAEFECGAQLHGPDGRRAATFDPVLMFKILSSRRLTIFPMNVPNLSRFAAAARATFARSAANSLLKVASYQERRLVQPPGGHQPAVDLISPLAPMYGRHGSS